MTIFYQHHDELRGPVGGIRSPTARLLRLLVHRAVNWTIAVCRIVHRAIVAARMRRLRPEPTVHTDLDKDAAKFPQPPLILGDKWDF